MTSSPGRVGVEAGQHVAVLTHGEDRRYETVFRFTRS